MGKSEGMVGSEGLEGAREQGREGSKGGGAREAE